MADALLWIVLALQAAAIGLILVLWRRGGRAIESPQTEAKLLALAQGQERSERLLREETAKAREETAGSAKHLREEVGTSLRTIQEMVLKSIGEISLVQKNQLEAFSAQLGKLSEANQNAARQNREEAGASLKAFNDSVLKRMTEMAAGQQQQLDAFSLRLNQLIASNEQKLDAVRTAVEQKLQALQEDNSKKLEQMRATVDEKLQGTLEKRLGESFKLVSERLEQVHRGLGEMQTLANGVGDLRRMLTNVKTRGAWGEQQVENLLQEFLTADQYGKNVVTVSGSRNPVEFAIKFPDANGETDKPVWLPVDAKFPTEDYDRLLEATQAADPERVEAALKQLEVRIKLFAKDICDKYVHPPETLDFGIMFLPTEGLYAEVLRRPGLHESIRRTCKVLIVGPTNFAAVLASFRMGFQKLAIQKRAGEVWDLLGAIKTEFNTFGEALGKVQKKLQEASNTIDQASVRTRAIERKLRNVHEIPASQAQALLGGNGDTLDQQVVDLHEERNG